MNIGGIDALHDHARHIYYSQASFVRLALGTYEQ